MAPTSWMGWVRESNAVSCATLKPGREDEREELDDVAGW